MQAVDGDARLVQRVWNSRSTPSFECDDRQEGEGDDRRGANREDPGRTLAGVSGGAHVDPTSREAVCDGLVGAGPNAPKVHPDFALRSTAIQRAPGDARRSERFIHGAVLAKEPVHLHPIPVTILAGSDLRAGEMPGSARGLHPLVAYKGVELRAEGRPVIELLVERLHEVEGFGEVFVAGPRRAYAALDLNATIIDTDGSIATNLRAAIERHRASNEPGPMALLACDVVLETGELARLREAYEADADCAVWVPVVRVPEDETTLGEFGWKPSYSLRVHSGDESIRVLPGHLGIFDPESLRWPLLYRLLDTAYRTRNRPVGPRRRAMVLSILRGLLVQDLKAPFLLRAPTLTASVLWNGLRFANGLKRGELVQRDLERFLSRVLIRRGWRRRFPDAGVRTPVVDILSLAEDVDTEEEVRELRHQHPG